MAANTADEWFALVLDPASNIVKSKEDLATTLKDFDAPDDVKAAFIDAAKIGPKGGVVHMYYRDLLSALGEGPFFQFVERLGMSQKMFNIFNDRSCTAHPIGQYGRCDVVTYYTCITGLYGCA